MKTTSLNELVFELMEKHRGLLKNADPLVTRIVIDWVQNTRAMVLKQKFERPFRVIDQNLIQNLGDIQMEQISGNDLGLDDGSILLRTSVEVPTTIESNHGIGTWSRIGSPNKAIPKFNIVTYERALASGNGKFNRNRVYAFPLGSYIYLWSKSGIHLAVDKVNLQGVFQDPIAAARFVDATWTYDDNYPINKSTIDMLKDLIVKTNFNFVMAPLTDKVEGDSDKVEPGVVPQQKSN